MGVDRDMFYDRSKVAIAAMGFCFPGYDAHGGDLPPRRECARLWHDRVFALMPQVDTLLIVGGYAQRYHFARLNVAFPKSGRVDDIVRSWRDMRKTRPRVFPLPHPSWRNSGWLKRNPWFEEELVPELRAAVRAACGAS
jgi:uracil-DNA glycosylase